jgi:hypothetical protein
VRGKELLAATGSALHGWRAMVMVEWEVCRWASMRSAAIRSVGTNITMGSSGGGGGGSSSIFGFVDQQLRAVFNCFKPPKSTFINAEFRLKLECTHTPLIFFFLRPFPFSSLSSKIGFRNRLNGTTFPFFFFTAP